MMTTIQLQNTKTRQKEAFAPISPENVRMYVCGPTVYDRAHIGNARPVIVFDLLYRLLRHVYGAQHVTYVRNFTDVDDRINATAQTRKADGAVGTLEELIAERAEETIGWYHADMDALGALRPDHEPRATGYIGQMVTLCEDLIARGHAYAAEGHVLFAVESYADYGALSGRSVEDMIAGARVEVAPYKRNPMDFVLWKPSPDDLPGWDSPWGRGRPGWHIECSAMAHELLGAHFDIHGGGNDLQFPHHENEIAQSTCVGHQFANVWMHNEMLQVEGKKMSKSLGNFFTVRDVLDQGVPGAVIRFVFLSTHYRKPMDWTEKKRAEAEQTLKKWGKMLHYGLSAPLTPDEQQDLVPQDVIDAIANDLNTSLALTILHQLFSKAQVSNGQGMKVKRFAAAVALLGFDHAELTALYQETKSGDLHLQLVTETLEEARATAMHTKDFSEVDRIKSALIALGIEVQMSKEGVSLTAPPGFDPTQLEGAL